MHMDRQDMAVRRPSPWLLGPVCTAFLLFGVAHRDYLFPSLCLLAVLATYAHRLKLDPLGKTTWRCFVGLALVAWTLCYAYYWVYLQGGDQLQYFPRLFYKPWMITTGGMMPALAVVWAWHGGVRRTTGLIIACTGLMAVSSSNFLSLPRFYLSLLTLFFATTLLALTGFGGERRGGRKKIFWRLSVAVGCMVIVISGTWTLSIGMHVLETTIDNIIRQAVQSSTSTDVTGAAGLIRLKRQRRVALSRKVVATVDGAAWPGYLRVQVMSDYRQGRWKTDLSSARAIEPVVETPGGHGTGFDLPFVSRGETAGTAHTMIHRDSVRQRTIRLLGDLGDAVPLPYATQHVLTSDPVSLSMANGGIVQADQPGVLRTYTVVRRTKATPSRYGIGASLMPVSTVDQIADHTAALPRDLEVPDHVLKPLGALAQVLVGNNTGSPLEHAQILQRYFQQHYTYALDVHLSAHGDPVVDFVLNRRPAYCEYYASGFALMLRALGIPARVVGGFAVKEYNPFAGQWIVRQRDAHAWTEVFDTASGRWVAFDATPPSATRYAGSSRLALVTQSWDWVELRARILLSGLRGHDWRSLASFMGAALVEALTHPFGLVAPGLLLLFGLGVLYRRQVLMRLTTLWRMRLDRLWVDWQPTVTEAQRLFDRVAYALQAKGLPIGHTETIEAYLSRVSHRQCQDEFPQVRDLVAAGISSEPFILAFARFARIYTDLRFRPTPTAIPTEQLAMLRHAADQALKELRRQRENGRPAAYG